MSRKKSKNRSPKKHNYILFVEGFTERNYFQALFQLYRISFAKVIKIEGSGQNWVEKSLNNLKNNRRSLNYDSDTKVYVIFDKDDICSEQIDKMQEIISKKKINLQLGISNCSFEVWLLAHYIEMTSVQIGIRKTFQKDLQKKLTAYLKEEYSKNKKKNVKQIQKILNNDRNRVNIAIENVGHISGFKEGSQSTDIGRIVSDIIS